MHQPQVEDPFPDLVVGPAAVPPAILGDSQRMIPAQVDRVTGQVWVPLEQAVKLNTIYTPPATPAATSVQPRSPTPLSQAASSAAVETNIMIQDEEDAKDTMGNIQLLPQQNPNEPQIIGDIINIDVDPIPNDKPLAPLPEKDEGVQCLLCLELGILPFYTWENARNEHVRAHVEQCGQDFAAVLGRCFPDRSASAPAADQPQKKKASESKTKKKLTPSTSLKALPAKKKKKEEKEVQKKAKLSVRRSQPTQEKQMKSSAGKQRTNERIEQEWGRVLGTLKSAKSITCRKSGCEASFKEAGQLSRCHLAEHIQYHMDAASTARITRSYAKQPGSAEDEKLLVEIQTCFPA